MRQGITCRGVALMLVLAATLVVGSGTAVAASGGAGPGGSKAASSKPKKGTLVGGKAKAPAGAPRPVVAAIKAGNQIRRKPYKWGGGHGRWKDSGYDCSGAVSYLLHAAGVLSRPLDSGGLMRWGKKGKGKWISVAANRGHTYIVVAGLRMDTSGTGGKGPRWSKRKLSSGGGRYKIRHPKSL